MIWYARRRPDNFGIEKQNPGQPSGVQHMVKGSACVSAVRSVQKIDKLSGHPPLNCD